MTGTTQLQFKGVFDLPFKYNFKGTTVGGLSGIDYDAKNKVYYLISDDRSSINPARFYTADIRISDKGIDSVVLLKMIHLLNPAGVPYPDRAESPKTAPDPEGIRFNAKNNTLVWSSEGERSTRNGDTVFQDPFIQIMDKEGKWISSYTTPGRFKVYQQEYGIRHNGSWEGITFSHNHRWLWAAMEEPLYQDGSRAGLADSSAFVRISKFNTKTLSEEQQFVYRIDPVAYPPVPAEGFRINGVVDILWLKDLQFLVMERSFSEGKPGCVIKIYQADFTAATEISGVETLKNINVIPASKKLVFNSETLPFTVYNMEGITIGPKLNGYPTLVLVADDNFSEKDKTQFLLFTIQ